MKLAVTGTGIVSPRGYRAEDIVNHVCGTEASESSADMAIRSVDWNTLRRTTQYSKILIKSAELAIEQTGLELESSDKERIGTVVNTSYGPIKTNLKFARSVLKGDPDLASPMVFANTVTNASLGHLCITFGLKGDSTFLMGSNPVKYAAYLLQKQTVDRVLVSGIEEYSEELASDYEAHYPESMTYKPSECCATLLLEPEASTEKALGYIYANYGMSLNMNPYWEAPDKWAFREDLVRFYSDITAEHPNIDLAIAGASGTALHETEMDVFRQFHIPRTYDCKEALGEVFGASLVAYINLALHFLKQDRDIRTIAVNHLDISMNYFTVIVGRE